MFTPFLFQYAYPLLLLICLLTPLHVLEGDWYQVKALFASSRLYVRSLLLAFYLWLFLSTRALYHHVPFRHDVRHHLPGSMFPASVICYNASCGHPRRRRRVISRCMHYHLIMKSRRIRCTSLVFDSDSKSLATSCDRWFDTQDDIWYDIPPSPQDNSTRGLDTLELKAQSEDPSSLTPEIHRAYVATTSLLSRLGVQPSSSFHGPSQAYLINKNGSKEIPIVIDTGCSISVSPYEEDFITPIERSNETKMHGLKDSIDIGGVGQVEWTIRDVFNRVATIRTRCYHIPSANIRLCSTQTYFQENRKGSLLQDHAKVVLTTSLGEVLTFPYQLGSNLPLMYLDFKSASVGLSVSQVYNLLKSSQIDKTLTLLHQDNYNLSKQAKELLLWHNRLGHAGFAWIQTLMCKPKDGEPTDVPVIPTKTTGVHYHETPKCAACQLAKQHKRSPGSQRIQAKPEREMAIRRNNLRPGDCISADQFTSRTPGRLATTRGREQPQLQYNGGTIFTDHASSYMFLHNQISLRVGETLQGKHQLEDFASQFGIKIKSYHADNHPFGADEFLQDIELLDQSITFSGVGAHFQNGVSERSIQTITSWALAMMLHHLLHWPSTFDQALWPFALQHAITLWNNLPKSRNGLTPLELFTGTKSLRHDVILNARVWGCPVYVLDPRLQDGQKLPKWSKRSRLGMYLGTSTSHSPTVGLILNLQTGHVSPQYHVVYDELFTTVQGQLTDDCFDRETWLTLLNLGGYDHNFDPDDLKGNKVPIQDFYDDFVPTPRPSRSPVSSVSEGDEPDVELGETSDDPDNSLEGAPSSSQRSKAKGRPKGRRRKRVFTRPKRRHEPRKRRANLNYSLLETLLDPTDPHFASSYYCQTHSKPSPKKSMIQHHQYLAHGNVNQKIKARSLQTEFIQGLDWSPDLSMLKSFDAKRCLLKMLSSYNEVTKTLESWNPFALAAKANDADTPDWNTAMNGPNAEGFWEACKIEIETLEKMKVWDVVKREPWMNVLPSTWAFKVKRYPDGLVKKIKSRFCSGGHRQIKDVDYFETYAPVVNWTTVRLLLVLTAQLGLATKQVDYNAAFVHADIDLPPNYDTMTPEEQARQGVFVEMPRGFRTPGHVLKLKKNLYGLKQAPRNWFNHLKSNLEAVGFVQAIEVDACLFISDKVICLVYVDDCILVAKNVEDVDATITALKNRGMDLSEEDDVAGFLGVRITRTEDSVTLTQKGLAQRIVDALQIQDLPTVSTPADDVLGKDEDGDPPNGTFSVPSVIGMLWYLYGHSRPDLGFAVSQVARFAFSPKRSHELALIRIGQYLKGTLDQGMTMKPMTTDSFKMDVYVDSDFLGMYGKEPRSDPDNVRSRTGYVILLNKCPVIWKSTLQDTPAMSTMMAEYYALSSAMREVLPLRALTQAVARGSGLNEACLTTFHTTVWEDNVGALTLANLEPGQNTPRSKFYDSKVHWFRSYLKPNHIEVKKIDTKYQLADLFTKPLLRDTFQFLRKLLIGW